MTGAIDMGANSISNLQTPTLDLQAANKSYVDTAVAGITAGVGGTGAIQAELDVTQTGVGLGIDGSYSANSGMVYISGAASVVAATELLDTQVKINADAITINTAKASMVLGTSSATALAGDTSLLQLGTTTTTALAGDTDGVAFIGSLTSNAQNQLDAKLALAGGTMTGAIDMGANSISNLQTPTLDLQAANKSYVDTAVADITAGVGGTGAIQAELDLTQTGVGLGIDGSYSANSDMVYISGAASVVAATELLDTQVKINADAITINTAKASMVLGTSSATALAGDTSLLQLGTTTTTALAGDTDGVAFIGSLTSNAQNQLDAKLALAGGTMTGAIDMGANSISNLQTPTLDLQAANKSYVDTAVADITAGVGGTGAIQAELDLTQTGVGLGIDGSYSANSDMVYISGAASVVAATELLDTQVKINADAITINTAKASMVLGTSSATALAGDTSLLQLGTTTTTALAGDTDGVAFIGSLTSNAQNQLDAKLALAGGTMTGAIDMGANSISNLQTPTLDLQAANKSYVDTAVADITAGVGGTGAIQAELDLTQTGVGLGIDGSYSANSDMVYISGAASVVAATELLDTQVKINADAITINTAKASMVLGTSSATALAGDTSLLQLGTTTTTALAGDTDGVAFIGSLTSNAQNQLDAKLALAGGTMTGAIDMGANSISNLQTPTLDLQAANKSYVDTAVADITAGVGGTGAIQAELDLTQTGVGLGIDGSYSANSDMVYISGAASVVAATELLDTQVKINADAITINTAKASMVLGTSSATALAGDTSLLQLGTTTTTALAGDTDGVEYIGSLTSNAQNQLDAKLALAGGTMTGAIDMGANSISNLQTPTLDLQAANKSYVDTAVADITAGVGGTGAIQAELDLTQTGVGLGIDGSYSANSDMVYISGAASVVAATELLDTQVKINADAITINTAKASMVLGTSSATALAGDTSLLQLGTTTTTALAGDTDGVAFIGSLTSNAQNQLDAKLALAGGTMTGAIDMGANSISNLQTPTLDLQAANKSYVDTAVADITAGVGGTGAIQAELDLTQTGVGLGIDGSYSANSDMVYISGAASVVAATELLDTQVKINADAITINTAKASMVLGTSSATALAGDTSLLQLGTTTTTALAGDTDGVEYIGSLTSNAQNQLDAKLALAGGTMTGAIDMGANSISNLQTPTLDLQAANKSYVDTAVADITAGVGGTGAIQAELDLTQTGVGLGIDGSYSANSDMVYISGAASVVAATELLDTQVKINADAITINTAKASMVLGTSSATALAGDTSLLQLGTTTTTALAGDTDGVAFIGSLTSNAQNQLDAKLALAGGTMTGAIDMGANSISNLQTPTLDLQAANKSYVDTAVADITAGVGGTGAIQAELDLTQTGVGLGIDGSYSANSDMVYISGAASVVAATELLDTQVKINADAITINTAKASMVLGTSSATALAGDTSLLQLGTTTTTALAGDTDGVAFIGSLTSNAQNQLDAKLALAGGTMTGAIDMGANSISNLQTPTLDLQAANKSYVDTAVADITAGVGGTGAIQAELDLTQTGVGLGIDGSYSANSDMVYISGAASVVAATELLDTQVKINADAITINTAKASMVLGTSSATALAGDTSLLQLGTTTTTALAGDTDGVEYIGSLTSNAQNQLDAKLALAGGTMTGAIDMGANSISNLQTPTLDLQAANKSYVDTAVADITAGVGGTGAIQAELDLTQTGVGLGIDGSYSANSDMVYISGAASVVAATELLDTQVKINADAITINTAKASMVLGTSSATALAGDTSLLQLGTTTTTALAGDTDGVAFIGSLTSNAQNQLDAKLALAGGTMTGAIDMGANSISNLQTPTLDLQAANKSYVDTAVADITAGVGGTGAIQAELDLTQTGVGLGIDGSYSANSDMVYISGAASVVAATELLDTQVKINADAITINTAKASMVLGTSSATALAGDTSLLQLGTTTTTALAGDTDGVEYIGSLTSNAQNQLDAKLALAGGTMTGAIDMGANSISNLQTPTLDLQAANKSYVDTAVAGIAGGEGGTVAIQAELDLTQTGVGLGIDGSYSANSDMVYISGAASVVAATELLDTQVKINADAITINTAKASMVLGTSSATALAGDTSLLQLGTTTTTALAGDTDGVEYIGSLTSNAQTQLDAKLALAGGTMTGAIDMGANSISNLQTPTDNSDAAH